MSKQKKRLQEYQVLEQIGRGTFSNVYKAERKSNKQIIALKEIRKQISQKDLLLVQNQIDILNNVKSLNIIKFYGDFKENKRWYLGFQYCPNGDLNQLLKKRGMLQQETVQMIAYCISSALFVLHNNNIVHRDLKLANILINENFEIKLADFGFSRNSEEQLMQTYCGTPITMAPQILQRKGYSQNCDTWSLGIIVYQMLYGTPPFLPQQGKGFEDLVEMIVKKKLQFRQGVNISEQCKCFLEKCLTKDLKKRPSIKEIMNDAWILQGEKRMKQEKNIFERELPSQLSISPKFGNHSSYDEKVEIKQEIQAAFGYIIQQHYQGILKNLCLNNIKNIYKRCSEILNQQTLKLLPYLFLKRLRSLNSISIKLNYLQKSVVVPLKSYKGYIKIQTMIVEFLKQLIAEIKDGEVNLEKAISLDVYDVLIVLIQNPPQNSVLLQKLQTTQSLIEIIDASIGDGQVSLIVNSTAEPSLKNLIIDHLNNIKQDQVPSILNKQHNNEIKREQVGKLFKFQHKYCEVKHVGTEYQQLQYVKQILKRRIQNISTN